MSETTAADGFAGMCRELAARQDKVVPDRHWNAVVSATIDKRLRRQIDRTHRAASSTRGGA